MAHVLVTGATGFIGHHVVDRLLQLGHRVTASSSSAEKAAGCPWFNQVDYKPLDLSALNDGQNYFDYFNRPDIAIHLSWEGLPNYTSDIHLKHNLPQQQIFLANLVRNGLSSLTVTGTCFEYGMREGKLDERMPASPANAYAQAKDQLRLFLEALQSDHSFLLKWVRLFYMYGKGQNAKSLFSQLQAAIDTKQAVFNMSGGEQVRDYLPVETVAANIVAIALQPAALGIINCCSGIPVTVKEMVERYLLEKGASLQLNLGYYPYTSYEPMSFWGDAGKLHKILNDKHSIEH